MKNRLWTWRIAAICLTISVSCAGEDPAKMEASANELFRQGDYFRAITAYKQVLFEAPPNARAELRIAESYLLAGQLEEAERTCRDIAMRAEDDRVALGALEMLLETLRKQGRFSEAAEAAGESLALAASDEARDALRAEMFWCHLYDEGGETAKADLRDLSDEHLRQRLSQAHAASTEFRGKKPLFAGCLSAVLPGAGQLYVGRRKDALIAFTINAAFIWAAIEAYNEDLAFTGTAFAIVELSWYTGNIYSAVGGAHKHNTHAYKKLIESIESEFGDLSHIDRRGIIVPALAARWRF